MKKKKQEISIDEEMLIWTSYRYCIGRKTYVSTLAPYIGKKYYNLLSDERLDFMARDIRSCIYDQLRFNIVSFHYEGSVFEKERNALGDFLTWINENIGKDSDWLGIKEVICYKDSYSEDAPKKFEVRKSDRVTLKPFQSDFEDLMIWEKLASFFDKKNYKKVLVDFKGKEQEVLCFEVWQRDLEETEERGIYLYKEWKYRKVLISVENYIEKGEGAGYLDPKYIKSIKNCE
jgi:hypothetical protein